MARVPVNAIVQNCQRGVIQPPAAAATVSTTTTNTPTMIKLLNLEDVASMKFV